MSLFCRTRLFPLFLHFSAASLLLFCPMTRPHRRRIKTEEKAKVVAAAWGAELIQFLAAVAILHQEDLKNRMKSSLVSMQCCRGCGVSAGGNSQEQHNQQLQAIQVYNITVSISNY